MSIEGKAYEVQAICPACGKQCKEMFHDYGWELKRVPFQCKECHTRFIASIPTDRPQIVVMWEQGEEID